MANKQKYMKVILIPQKKCTNSRCDFLKDTISEKPLSRLAFSLFCNDTNTHDTVVAFPLAWRRKVVPNHSFATYRNETLQLETVVDSKQVAKSEWVLISNGRFFTHCQQNLLSEILDQPEVQVTAVNISPELSACRERLNLTSSGNVAGLRRIYENSVLPVRFPSDWPHHLYVRSDIFNRLFLNQFFPVAFPKFVARCELSSVSMRALNVAGDVLDLETEADMLKFCMMAMELAAGDDLCEKEINMYEHGTGISHDHADIDPSAKLFGKVLICDNVRIGPSAIVCGPVVLGCNVKVASGAVVRNAIIRADIRVPADVVIQNRILTADPKKSDHVNMPEIITTSFGKNGNVFRTWPLFSYPRFFKRIADIAIALIVITLFAPVFPVIMLAIKLSSKGNVFFNDRRQGLAGREFNCLKFRSMIAGADKMQKALRIKNEVDGPQFKMKKDPRISVVGAFLRNTYLDEIPQFFNVLLGQMSIVGPRPSPRIENSCCSNWRNARLSVRPGITGLWQVCRTRRSGQDFQEWLYYDTQYIKKVSLRLDIWICLKTAIKLIRAFLKQF